MRNVLKSLYYGELGEFNRPISQLQKSEEFKKMDFAYDKLMKSLSEEQKKLFEEYFHCEALYTLLEKERDFLNGVKLGMCLALELVDFEPSPLNSENN